MSDLDEFIKMRPEERPTLPPGVRPDEIKEALERARLDDEKRAREKAEQAANGDETEREPTLSLPDTPLTPTLSEPTARSEAADTLDPPDRSALVFATAMVITVGLGAAAAFLGYAAVTGFFAS